MIICEQYFNDNDDEIVNVDDITSVGKLIEFDYRIQLSNTTYGY